jgi:hypothetical protein
VINLRHLIARQNDTAAAQGHPRAHAHRIGDDERHVSSDVSHPASTNVLAEEFRTPR